MGITVTPVKPDFVAEISGIDLARLLDTTKVRDFRRVTTRDVASTLEQAA